MAKVKKNRKFTKKELIEILQHMVGYVQVIPLEEQSTDQLYTLLQEEIKKPPPPPPGP